MTVRQLTQRRIRLKPTTARYLKDTFFEVYNNSEETVYADGICLGDALNYKIYDFSDKLENVADYVFIGQAGGDYLLSASIGQSHSSHIKTYAIKDQPTFLFTEQLHHITAGVYEDEDVTAVQASTHGVGNDTA